MTAESRLDPPSLGNPRLVFAYEGQMSTTLPQREFPLVDGVTTIGSAEDADLCLLGLDPQHAEIRHDESGDYTYVPLGAPTSGSVHGRPDVEAILRTGTRIEFGTWTVSFSRDEFADSSVAAETEPGQRFAQQRDEARAAQAADGAA